MERIFGWTTVALFALSALASFVTATSRIREPAAIAKPAAIPIDGWYNVSGKQDNGVEYAGTALVIHVKDDTYRIHWLIAYHDPTADNVPVGRADGVGIRSGMALAIGYADVTSMYKIEVKDGKPSIKGRYVVASGSSGEETWEWAKR